MSSFLPRRNITGFTLVELMVVISIIAILSAIGLTVFSQAQKSARDGKRISDLGETQKALEQYYAVNRNYPDAPGTGLVKDIVSLDSYFQNNVPPSDPNTGLSGFEYHYYACSASPNTQYIICAKPENCGTQCNVAANGANPNIANGCANLSAPASGNVYYCFKGLSN